jgi:hypothetical protein
MPAILPPSPPSVPPRPAATALAIQTAFSNDRMRVS